jgi:hypothetical protein
VHGRFPPWPPEEATGPFDGMGDAEDVIGNHGVVRFLFESRQLHIDDIGAFARLERFPHQLVHGTGAFEVIRAPPRQLLAGAKSALHPPLEYLGKRFIFGCAAYDAATLTYR